VAKLDVSRISYGPIPYITAMSDLKQEAQDLFLGDEQRRAASPQRSSSRSALSAVGYRKDASGFRLEIRWTLFVFFRGQLIASKIMFLVL
jgi:hypothetical protein